MGEYENVRWTAGYEAPLIADEQRDRPCRREVSGRWVAALSLAAAGTMALIGLGLSTVTSGSSILKLPADSIGATRERVYASFDSVAKARRTPVLLRPVRIADRRLMDVSTLFRNDNRDVVRKMPFVYLKMTLDGASVGPASYPPFDPLKIFAGRAVTDSGGDTGRIYGADVAGRISLQDTDFFAGAKNFGGADTMSLARAEKEARSSAAALRQVAASDAGLPGVDPSRFGGRLSAPVPRKAAPSVHIVAENVSRSSPTPNSRSRVFSRDAVPVRQQSGIADALAGYGFDHDAATVASALVKAQDGPDGSARLLRIGSESGPAGRDIMRVSLYADGRHVATVARTDQGRFVSVPEPDRDRRRAEAKKSASKGADKAVASVAVYDAINRSALSYGLPRRLTRQIIRLLAADVNFQAPLGPSDRLEVFFSKPGRDNRATDDSRLYYVRFAFSGNYGTLYRFETSNGDVDYFDSEGHSLHRFLLRNPVRGARLASGFGMRHHPILGGARMHGGVDWAASEGTPVVAAASGIVEKTGWSSGYGRRTVLRHPNGYETTYSHQSSVADGVVPGAAVRQGEVIGFVGDTGLTTGPHLHYEVLINGKKVDPMRVRLPDRRVLRDANLDAFLKERDRIDALLYDPGEATLQLTASNE